MLSLVYFILVLSVLVFIHEFGHFIAAKRVGVSVEKFSIGFGRKLFSVKKGGTEYMLSAIPLGGYVKMAGDEPGEARKNEKHEFLSQSVGNRFQIIFAGPLFNYILAIVIFSFIFMFGSPTLTTEVGDLLKDYPAQAAGVMKGDKVISVDGKDIKYWEDMTAIIHKHSKDPIKLSILRSGKMMEINITPIVRETKDIFGKKMSIALVGIAPSQKIETVKYGFFQAWGMGFRKVIDLTVLTYRALWAIFTGQMSVKESMTGPIGIFVITGQAAKMGLIYLCHLMAILSASLAIFNLLPLPVLDGGHIIFLGIEKLRGKPLSYKTQDKIANIGVTLLILLTIFIFYNDIIKFQIVEKVVHIFKK